MIRAFAILALAWWPSEAFTGNLRKPSPRTVSVRSRGGGAKLAGVPLATELGAATALQTAVSTVTQGLVTPPAASTWPIALAVNTLLFAPVVLKGQSMLTGAGVINAWILGTVLWASTGWQGWGLCVLYLLAGSKVTKVKMKEKTELGISEGRGGRRGPENVWGSAATGALCALACLVWPSQRSLLTVGYVASI